MSGSKAVVHLLAVCIMQKNGSASRTNGNYFEFVLRPFHNFCSNRMVDDGKISGMKKMGGNLRTPRN